MLAQQATGTGANLAVFPLFNSPTCLWKTQNNLRSLDSTDSNFCMYGHGWVVGRGGGSLGEEPPVAQQREDRSHWGTVLSEVYIASELSERKTPFIW